jgi:hypothetical protein
MTNVLEDTADPLFLALAWEKERSPDRQAIREGPRESHASPDTIRGAGPYVLAVG